ncbi:MAG: T9SS type A sorting domain-containing protein [Balneolaceae bacterium]|nr:T9SS type A sorting domain-containing protein [Balneolaceae bacterium]
MNKLGWLFIILCWVLVENAVSQEIDKHSFPKGKLIEITAEESLEAGNLTGSREKMKNMDREIIFSENFEINNDLWRLSPGWNIGNVSLDTAPQFNTSNRVAGTYLNGTYDNNDNSTLISTDISLPSVGSDEKLILELREWYQIESGYDFGYIELSEDGGATWNKIHSRNGQSSWHSTKINLSRCEANTIQLRFRLTSDSTNSYRGWYIDNLQIYKQKTENVQVTITSLNSQNFPNIYMNAQVDTAGTGISDLTQNNFAVFENDLLQTDLFNVTPPEQGGGVRRADIVFLMDNSGSMDEEQSAVENNVFDFVDRLAASNVDFALGLARYGASEEGGNPIIEDGGSLTSDANYFKNDVWARNVVYGSDEPGYYTMTEAISNFNFRPGAQRIFIIITDETPDQGGATQNEARTQLVEGDVTLFSLTTSYLASEFQPLTDATGGEIFNIYSSFSDILDFIAAEVASSYVVSYRSGNTNRDGTKRTVRIEVTYEGKTVQDEETYIPGAAPEIKITENTKKLSDQGRAQGTPLTIEANIQDDIAPTLEAATLYYKRSSNPENSYQSISMSKGEDNLYTAQIPAEDVAEPGIDYYITATDGSTTSSNPSTNPRSNPYNIAILPNEPPAIDHTPIGNAAPGQPLNVMFTASDATNRLDSVTLYYRRSGRLNFMSTTVDDVGNQSEFTLKIPAEFLTTDGLEYYIEATDDLGISSTVGTSDTPISVITGVLVNISLSYPENGPQSSILEVPENGKAYTYYRVSSSETSLFHNDEFTLALVDQNETTRHETRGRVIGENLIQVAVPHSLLEGNSAKEFRIANRFNIGDTTYSLGGIEKSFKAIPADQPYTRTWNIFSERSAGISACIGCIGAGATASAATASISGSGGVGLGIELNEYNNLALSRKMDAGLATSLEIPSVKPGVGDVDIGVEGELIFKLMSGQKLSFDGISNVADDTKKMAQTGFFLETLSLSGATLSPVIGTIITATANTINNLGEIDQYFEPAMVSEFWGLGLEGSVTAGPSYTIGPLEVSAIEATNSFVLNAYHYSYPVNQNENFKKFTFSDLKSYSGANESTASSTKFTFANNIDLSSLSWNVQFHENSENDIAGGSLISTGTGSELAMARYMDRSGNLQHLEFSLTGGGNLEYFGINNRQTFISSALEIPGNYSDKLLEFNSVFGGIIQPENNSVPLGNSIGEGLQTTFNKLTESIDNDRPLKLVNNEKRGKGFNYDFDASIGVGFVAGGSIDLGFNLQMYDEIQYPKNYVEIYNGGNNYLIQSTEYSPGMADANLSELLNELLSGTLPLLDQAWNNLVNSLEEAISRGEDFLFEAANTASESVGAISGIASRAGDIFISIYSPDSKRIRQRAFEKPEIKSMYSSPNVFYSTSKQSGQLLEANSTLIVISDAMQVNFQPDGSTETVEQLDTPITLEMELKDSYLSENDFTSEDRDRVKLYRYNLQINGWIRVGGELNNGALSEEVTAMGTYALGIEIQRENDQDPPRIYEADYLDESENDGANVIYAKVKDNKYGIGLDFSNTHMILNKDTLSYTYQPRKERIFYQLSDAEEQAHPVKEVQIIAADQNGNKTKRSFTFKADGTDSINSLPNQAVLHENYPNPFNPQTTIPFEVPEQTDVEINIYDVLGRYIETVFEGEVRAGPHNVTWNPSGDRASGIYFYQIRTDTYNQVKKMMYVK